MPDHAVGLFSVTLYSDQTLETLGVFNSGIEVLTNVRRVVTGRLHAASDSLVTAINSNDQRPTVHGSVTAAADAVCRWKSMPTCPMRKHSVPSAVIL